MSLRKELRVKPGSKVKLSDWDPDDTLGHEKGAQSDEKTAKLLKQLDSLQYLLYAEKKHAVLVVFQALDAAGKDGTIRHVMSGVNPQGCEVTSFKVPSRGRSGARFSVAGAQGGAGAGDDRDLQSIAL